jgi:hypothetical protein
MGTISFFLAALKNPTALLTTRAILTRELWLVCFPAHFAGTLRPVLNAVLIVTAARTELCYPPDVMIKDSTTAEAVPLPFSSHTSYRCVYVASSCLTSYSRIRK